MHGPTVARGSAEPESITRAGCVEGRSQKACATINVAAGCGTVSGPTEPRAGGEPNSTMTATSHPSGLSGPPLASTPLGRTVATTPTDIWNDSCSVAELGVRDQLRRRRSDGQSDDRDRRLEAGARATGATGSGRWPGRATDADRDGARVGRRRGDVSPRCPAARPGASRRATVARVGSRCRRTRRSTGRRSGWSPRRQRFGEPRPEHHRQVPGDACRHRCHRGGDGARRQRQRDRLLHGRPGGRRGRGDRARAAPARGRRRRHRANGSGRHDHGRPDRGLAPRPDRARRDHRRPGSPAVVRGRGLQARLRDLPGARLSRPAAGGGDPAPPPLVGVHWWRRGHHAALGLAEAVQRLRRRGPAPDGRRRGSCDRRRARGRATTTSGGRTSRTP